MQKIIYIFAFFLAMAILPCLLPYPILSNHTNITEADAVQINNFFESEISPSNEESSAILELDFEIIDHLLPIGTEFELCDIESEEVFSFVRTGGKNHADIEPSTTDESERFLQTISASWKRRPAVVKLNDTTFLPASLCAYPHGYSTLGTCNGHYCLHFLGSKTDGTQEEDFQHQKSISSALSKASNVIELF